MNQILDNLNARWRAADPRRRATLLIGGAGLALVLALLVRAALTPTMALLYSGLDSSAANGVVEGLERQGLAYEIRGDAIYVPSSERDRARIRLAGEGLPAAGAAGYEILDGLSGFGTTTEMFDAAYWRAKEGELARTILASKQIVRARVHIAQARRRPFEKPAPVTASVTVTTSSGALTRPQAESIRHLVAAAVAGLSLHDVAVIDQERGVVLKAGDQEPDATLADEAGAQAEALRLKVTRLLEARVGPGAAMVEVAVETARASETVRERILDPNGKIAVHTDKEESADQASGAADAVTVASNLPGGDVEDGGDSSSRQTSRTRERTNFEVSETVRETVRPAGRIERITVAVMVDGVRAVGPGGREVWEERSAEELEALRALVESAIGYSGERGDIVTIQSLEFTQTPSGVSASGGALSALSAHAGLAAQLAALVIAAAAIAFFVVRPLLSGPVETPRLIRAEIEDDADVIDMSPSSPSREAGDISIGAADETGFTPGGGGADGGGDDYGLPAFGDFGGGFGDMAGGDETGLRAQVEAAVRADPDRAIEILSEWLESDSFDLRERAAA